MDYTSEVAVGLARNPREALANALKKLSSPLPLSGTVKHIVIKPSIYDPASLGNTTWELTRALVRTFRSAADVLVVESDNPVRTAEEAFQRFGYPEHLEDLQVQLVNLSALPRKTISAPGHAFSEYSLPAILFDDAILINAPTLKPDPRVVVGGAVKNLFGLLPEANKTVYHERLTDVLLDLLSIVRPHLTVMDLTDVVVDAQGRMVAHRVGGLLVSTDPVAVDSIAAALLDIDPLNIDLFRRAHNLGLGEALPDRIRIVGTEHQRHRIQSGMATVAAEFHLGLD